MDSADYRDISSGPDVVKRPIVEATIRRLSNYPELVGRLKQLLETRPISKPAGHDAGSHTDHLVVDLSISELEELVVALGDNEASVAMSDANASALSYAATLLDTWNAILLFRKAAA